MQIKNILVPLNEKQQINLRDIRNEFSADDMIQEIDLLFQYVLKGMGSMSHAEDAAHEHWLITRAKQLATILLQPDIDI